MAANAFRVYREPASAVSYSLDLRCECWEISYGASSNSSVSRCLRAQKCRRCRKQLLSNAKGKFAAAEAAMQLGVTLEAVLTDIYGLTNLRPGIAPREYGR